MCKICEQWLSNDEDSVSPIGNTLKLDCGIFGEIKSEIEFVKSTDNDSPHELVHYLYPKELDGFEYERIEIQYCPFCGRDLRESK